jgi:predicted hydrocarbon binding protein
MIELVVMDAVRVSCVRCRARGDEACEFVIDWS